MSKKERRLYIFLAVIFVLYVVVEQYKPEPLVWIPTFAQKDKQPYGGYVLYERLDDFFAAKEISFETLYEHGDSVNAEMLILSSQFEPGEADFAALMSMLEKGNNVLIASSIFSEEFLDTLDLKWDDEFKEATLQMIDSLEISYGNTSAYYPKSQIYGVFEVGDSLQWNVVASSDKPVVIHRQFGEGQLILSTHPLAFTNYGILKSGGLGLPEMMLNLLDPDKVIYNRYYHSGRMESTSVFRYFISQPALRWALNLTLLSILLLLFIGSRRKQAKIDLLDPKTNTTIQFIKTMGGLYYREGRHISAAQKMVSHFLKTLKERYYISNLFDDATYQTLAVKTGLKKSEVIQTFEIIQHVKNGGNVSEEMLSDLNQKIEKFNIK
ncbi:DUF4350 domain-containing protein [Marinoscillum pacificum]|uniref:DUF4350 domain-containing protein n=1 Tax=Marinoscillum pacificum TaxID=392723 RepID=UPI00215769CD|nr:DUF4350 domain-containing protein [Marinoscillum pacificum]